MDKHLKTARILARLLDNQFSLFGIKFGFDPIFDLVPGLGDIVGAVLSLYIIWVGFKLETPPDKLHLMIRNVATDFLLGLLPLVGPIADIFYKSNQMNLKILEDFHGDIIEGEIIK